MRRRVLLRRAYGVDLTTASKWKVYVGGMNKALSIAFLVGGVVLLVFGFQASNSFGSDVSRAFTGNPTDKTLWFFVGGAALAVLGLIGLFTGRSKT